LGHIIKTGNQWIAFDGTHPNDASTGFRLLGTFPSSAAAKKAVEKAVVQKKPSGSKAVRGKRAVS
jgi:hypothetical protein